MPFTFRESVREAVDYPLSFSNDSKYRCLELNDWDFACENERVCVYYDVKVDGSFVQDEQRPEETA